MKAANKEMGKKPSTLYIICSQMSGFCYDSAKELSERERDAVKPTKPPLAGLMAALAQLCVIEKQYYSLTFLMPKRFYMKDTSLNQSYTNILTSLQKVEEWRSSSVTREMATQLLIFIEARLELLKMYESVANTGATLVQFENTAHNPEVNKNLEECVMPVESNFSPKISNLARKYKNCLSNENLKPLNDLLQWELDCLQGLFSCLHHLNHWRYMEALVELDKCKRALASWLHSLQTHTETKSMRLMSWFRASSPTPSTSSQMSEDQDEVVNNMYVEPALYSWFAKLRMSVLAKCTLYFYNTLAEHSTPEKMENNCAKLGDNDLVGKIQANLKRLEVTNFSMIFDATTEVSSK